jgi:hypothetical protein
MNAAELRDVSPSAFSDDTWDEAKALVAQLGAPSLSATFLVRSLLSDANVGPYDISHTSTFFLRRFFRSRSFQSPYFHAISLFRAERLEPEDQPFSAQDFIDSFSNVEHALLVALIFAHRTTSRRTDRELLNMVTEQLQRSLNLGWYVGKALRPVGQASGMMVGCARWIGMLPLARADGDGVRHYMRYLKRNSRNLPDAEYELQAWGCASIQVGLLLMQRMGFGPEWLCPLMRAITTRSPVSSKDAIERSYRVSEVWIQHILEDRSAPTIPLHPSYYLSSEKIEEISHSIVFDGNECISNWLSARRGDLTPETAPQLFCGEEQPDAASSLGSEDDQDMADDEILGEAEE